MAEKIELEMDDYETHLDEDEEDCEVIFTGETGEKVLIRMEREKAEEFATELFQLLGLNSRDDSDD